MRAINSGSQQWQLQQLGPASGFPAKGAVAAVVIRSTGAGHLRPAVDALLREGVPHSASYANNAELIALASLAGGAAGGMGRPPGVRSWNHCVSWRCRLGPWWPSDLWAGESVRRRGPWLRRVARWICPRPAAAAVSWTLTRWPWSSLPKSRWTRPRVKFVQRQLGAVVEHDRLKKSELMRTLAVWLDTGCNTAQAARELHLERQSLHHRLQRIFELCGGDPRGTGRLAALHLATRLARL